jgi:hypothetical protein
MVTYGKIGLKFEFDDDEKDIHFSKVNEKKMIQSFHGIPKYIRVSFECSPQAAADLLKKYGPLYEITLCPKSAQQVDVFAPQIEGVTFRYQLDGAEYKLFQVFPTAWTKVLSNALQVIKTDYVDVSSSVPAPALAPAPAALPEKSQKRGGPLDWLMEESESE